MESIFSQHNIDDYLKTKSHQANSVEKKKVQPTFHQQLAIETAKLLDDQKSLGIYLRLFKKYKWGYKDLIRCRDWVIEKKCSNKGRVFVVCYKKFLGLMSIKN